MCLHAHVYLFAYGGGIRQVSNSPYSVVLRDPEPALVLAAVSGLSREGKTEVEGRLMGSIAGREEGRFTT